MDLATIVEGRTMLRVPLVSLQRAEPPTVPAFFNPAASLNRDISVALVDALSGKSFCDALAGVGARGVRVAAEVRRKMQVTLVDFSSPSLRLARANCRLNGVADRCEFVGADTNLFLASRFNRGDRFDFVDVDPFGSPMRYVQAALNATADGGLLALTATDTAVLCGVHPKVAKRRYGAQTMLSSFGHETGLRILFNAARRVAAMLDIGLKPLAAHSTRHYLRVYARLQVGATRADEGGAGEGYTFLCRNCGDRGASEVVVRKCSTCGGKQAFAGPLWVKDLFDSDTARRAQGRASTHGFTQAARCLGEMADSAGLPPYGFRVDEISSALKVPGVSAEKVAGQLTSRGFKAGVQPFEKRGLKTEARYADVLEAVREVHRQGSPGPGRQDQAVRSEVGEGVPRKPSQ